MLGCIVTISKKAGTFGRGCFIDLVDKLFAEESVVKALGETTAGSGEEALEIFKNHENEIWSPRSESSSYSNGYSGGDDNQSEPWFCC